MFPHQCRASRGCGLQADGDRASENGSMCSMEDCVFCKIISGALPSEKIYEDEEVVAFLDIKPVNPGHALIVPKKHFRNVLDIPESLWLSTMKIAHRLAPIIKEAT